MKRFVIAAALALVGACSSGGTPVEEQEPQADPLAVQIAAPRSGAVVWAVVQVSGTSEGGVVEVSIDGGAFAPATGSPGWTYDIDTVTLADGPHTIVARVSSANGETSDSIDIMVQNAVSLAVDSLADGDVISGVVQVVGRAPLAVEVSVSVDGGSFRPATGTANWSFSLDVSALSHRHHEVSVRAKDATGGEVLEEMWIIVNDESPPPPDCTVVPGTPLPYENTAAPTRLDVGTAPTVYIVIIGHSENAGYDDDLQALLDADPPLGKQYVVTNHYIGGHQTYRWAKPGDRGHDKIESILADIRGPTVALILTSNNARYPIGTPDMSDANYARFVTECISIADHLHDNGNGAVMCYFSAHRMKPTNLMPSYYENLAMEDVMGEAASAGKDYIKPGPEQHDLHWCCFPDCYGGDFAHANSRGQTLMAEAWFQLLKTELAGP